MFCPNCAAKNSNEERFCRACGMNLEQVASALSEQVPDRNADLERSEQRIERFGDFAFIGLGIVLAAAVAGIVYTIITKMILSGTQPVAGIILASFVVFAALALTYVVLKEDIKDRKKTARAMPVPVFETDIQTDKLLMDPIDDPSPSVVEDTTARLSVESKTRKL